MDEGNGNCGPFVGGGLLLYKQHKLVKDLKEMFHVTDIMHIQ
jgi:hypothetical protein